mgnify:CR=1 FL=1
MEIKMTDILVRSLKSESAISSRDVLDDGSPPDKEDSARDKEIEYGVRQDGSRYFAKYARK